MLAVTAASNTLYEVIVSAIRAKGYTGSLRKWCKEVGLSESWLSNLHVRCKSNPWPDVDAATGLKIANATGIQFDELVWSPPNPDGRYPSRKLAIDDALALGISRAAIARGCEASPPNDPGRLWWFKRIEAAEFLMSGERPSAVFPSSATE